MLKIHCTDHLLAKDAQLLVEIKEILNIRQFHMPSKLSALIYTTFT